MPCYWLTYKRKLASLLWISTQQPIGFHHYPHYSLHIGNGSCLLKRVNRCAMFAVVFVIRGRFEQRTCVAPKVMCCGTNPAESFASRCVLRPPGFAAVAVHCASSWGPPSPQPLHLDCIYVMTTADYVPYWFPPKGCSTAWAHRPMERWSSSPKHL